MRKIFSIFGVGMLAATTPANAALLVNLDFDTPFTTGAGVFGVFGPFNATEAAAAGPWNAGGWAGNYAVTRDAGNPQALETHLQLSGLAPHTNISGGFILGFLESWDGNDINGNCCSPDSLEIRIDGVLVATLTSNNGNLGSNQFFGGGTILANYVQANGNTFFSDTLVDMSTAPFLNFAHTGSTLDIAIRATGTGWQGGSDEAWGIDNIRFEYNAVPEPATWAMMIAGFGLVGGAMRRRQKVSVTYA